MATRTSNTSNVRYASRSAVYGSNAYDLNRVGELSRARNAMPAPEIERMPSRKPEIRPDVKPSPKTTPKTMPTAAPKAAPQSSRKTQRSYGVSLYAAAGFAVVAVLMVFVLLANVRYAEVSSETVKLQKTLNQLTEDERKLMIQYEDVFDVNQVEQYATHQLGMAKPSESQIGTISASAQDVAVVADTQNNAPKHSENMATFLASLLAYFK